MNSTNIWKKRLSNDNKNKKVSSGILNRPQFKRKQKRNLSNLFKENLITNWIENEGDDEESESSSIDWNIFHKKCQIKTTECDEDSLQLDNLQYLSTMKHIIFLDLDNFSRFFQHLTNQIPHHIYIIAFQGSNIRWKPPKNNFIYENLLNSNNFQLMYPSGNRHDAADFALVLTFGKLHGLLSKSISFTIISGDKGFIEIIHQLKNSNRRINWFNPHQFSFENFNQILNITSI
ncbi:unnamed protein product [Adineta steineri]|uniref:ZNF451 PIN-like domain-containing protein n=1 Tax=Adineta steineri TaxID=433720 RepID=A0A814D8G6_9BILA|nr:unnamed protein product [Adineta steineri]CAF0956526.1 unnamed protein product [Adineta steineri]CAF0961555.1 unnamed protein product [Adineta steineri]